ncbi:hypothetical protein [Halorubrum sp. AS12]|uniref:hypothetical protein n=1 Tax=Halorubrum sp. AS12 TaxID=3409687 RepID=UPI003DA72974
MGADGDRSDRPAHLGRRTFVKGLGAAGAATIGLSVDNGFAQDAKAIAPLIGAGLVAGSVGVGWALREFEVVGADAPAEGLTADVLKQDVYSAARKRKSTNASTIVDNNNIIDGIRHTAYTEAKIAAIEQLNAGATESEVLSAAEDAAISHFTTIQKNMLDSWNEGMNEFSQLRSALSSHPDLSVSDAFTANAVDQNTSSSYNWSFQSWKSNETNTVTLFDGTNYDVQTLVMAMEASNDSTFDGKGDLVNTDRSGNIDVSSGQIAIIAKNPNGDNVTYQSVPKWNEVYSALETAQSDVLNGISTWVTNVYGDVQSGDIEISDLVTPKERAAMMAEEEGMNQAIADLIALNIPVDAEREATITIENSGAKLTGTFALTDSSDGPIESGTTYDPSSFSGDVYFTTDMSLVEGDWSAINTSVDGGTITITSEPYESTAIEVTTTAGETVSVPAGDWSAVDGATEWTYDASDDLETNITEVDSARFVSTATETQYETLQLDGSFTVNKLTNTQSGEEVTSTTFENSEPQDDSNYITQEEWDDLEEQNQKLIEKYENAQSGGGIDLGQFDMFGIPGEIVAVVVAALVALGVLSN